MQRLVIEHSQTRSETLQTRFELSSDDPLPRIVVRPATTPDSRAERPISRLIASATPLRATEDRQ